jgi:hypothetical protein
MAKIQLRPNATNRSGYLLFERLRIFIVPQRLTMEPMLRSNQATRSSYGKLLINSFMCIFSLLKLGQMFNNKVFMVKIILRMCNCSCRNT